MTLEEFNQWWKDVKTRFPTEIEWFVKLRDKEGQKATLETWFEMFAFTDHADAIAANKEIQSDGMKIHIDQFPALVRRIATAARVKRTPRQPEDWRRDSFKCLTCHDRGFVTVWHNKALRILHLDGVIKKGPKVPPTSASCRCSCSLGWRRQEQAEKELMPQYDPDGYCLLQGDPMSAESQSAAIQWMENRKKSFNEELAEWSA